MCVRVSRVFGSSVDVDALQCVARRLQTRACCPLLPTHALCMFFSFHFGRQSPPLLLSVFCHRDDGCDYRVAMAEERRVEQWQCDGMERFPVFVYPLRHPFVVITVTCASCCRVLCASLCLSFVWLARDDALAREAL